MTNCRKLLRFSYYVLDIAIGAPWEESGAGAVYIYMGTANGLSKKNVQKIQSSKASGFGWSVAKGVDVDQNKCNG